jgi:hypothetical protein
MSAQALTGQSTARPVECWWTVSFWMSVFWNSNVMAMASAEAMSGEVKSMVRLFLMNRRLRSRRGFVLRGPVTWVYSHERMAKKKAPIASLAVAFSAWEEIGSCECS